MKLGFVATVGAVTGGSGFFFSAMASPNLRFFGGTVVEVQPLA